MKPVFHASGEEPEANQNVPSPKATTSQTPSKTEQLFDLNRLRITEASLSIAPTKKIITVPVQKPNRQWFIRVHPDDAYSLQTHVLELKEERETYLVDPTLWHELQLDIHPVLLQTTITRTGTCFLWPINLPGNDGRTNEWNRSAIIAAQTARDRWVRIASNMQLGGYEVFVADGYDEPPAWPTESFQQLIETAFADRFIRSLDHPIVRKLRGEI